VDFKGLSLGKHRRSNNFSSELRELIVHLKRNSKKKIEFERLDPELLRLVNNIDDNYVRNFH